jgi:hypothetical protein
MTIPFIHRNPTKSEFERFRLILSTYQDGSGQQATKEGRTLPGWRDFERSIALAFNGIAQESKFIFDVLFPDSKREDVYFGLSCKMRRTLNDTKRTGRVTLELSNSSGAFWEQLRQISIHQQNYKDKPFEVAQALLAQEYEWHSRVGLEQEGVIDLSRSFYLALSWNAKGEYQLFKFSLDLPDPVQVTWDFPIIEIDGKTKQARRLRGQDERGTLFEWYGESGGQLKYYPLAENALWKSEIFHLEPLPVNWNEKHGILAKARDYFPKLWKE